eukprot:m.193062 g.193062  ORF g.193062 m.193062 type:complete len:134 (+) comp16776_c10_seq3:184-585(+)
MFFSFACLLTRSNAKVVASYAQRYQDSIRVISRDTKSNVSLDLHCTSQLVEDDSVSKELWLAKLAVLLLSLCLGVVHASSPPVLDNARLGQLEASNDGLLCLHFVLAFLSIIPLDLSLQRLDSTALSVADTDR